MGKQTGQILLIVVLVIIVASTIGLSVASRSITSLRSSTEEAESQKALAAAEAGIERTIQGNNITTGMNVLSGNYASNNSIYHVDVASVDGSTFLLNGGNIIPKDEGADLWLSTYDSDPASNYGSPWSGNLNVFWGDSATACNNSALEIIIISGSRNNPVSKKYAYDPCPTRQSENHFTAPDNLSGGSGNIFTKTFYYKTAINNVISAGLIARIIPIYGDTSVGIVGNSALPLQGYAITSLGTSGQANRKLRVFKGWPQTYLPYLSYGLFVAN